MKFIQGKVITRDNEFIAFGNSKEEIETLLTNLWKRHLKNNSELLTCQEFKDRIIYRYLSTGKGYVINSTNTTHKLF